MGLFAAMFDFQNEALRFDNVAQRDHRIVRQHWSKTVFDLVLSALLLFPLVIATFALLLFNPFFNAGPLLFLQRRMGHDCRPFTAIKFRTMTPEKGSQRGAFDVLEADRITALGRFLRKIRLDELPQIINVLRGEMSLIGPRPDSFEHASVYLDEVAGYAARHRIMPGISGIAQTEVGYVDGLDGIRNKVAADLYYVANASLRLDLWITWRTICVILGRKGS